MRAWILTTSLALTACGGTSGSDGGGATCESLCTSIEADCGADEKCLRECQQDQANAASCGDEDAWQALLDCCDGEDFAAACDEDGFDPCQGAVCEDLRPDSARAGCE